MTQEELQEVIAKAERAVAAMYPWQRGWLEASSRPSRSVPRTPVFSEDRYSD